jgi:hypothetical protein
MNFSMTGKTFVREMTLVYHPKNESKGGAKLTFSGSRTVSLDVPFTLKDVPLAKE